ncbi:phage tail protein I [Acetobacteraceae bacterium ESL0709]|nr:phage tail protein I [Acetobacteraceae bacterium ESL0709]
MAETLLPCNASPLERAIDQTAAGQLGTIPHYVRDTSDPDRIPPVLLPWLAWARRVEVWDSGWSDEQKRAVIKASFEVHRKKGTIGAIKSALTALGVSLEVIEWFQDVPKAPPYTFRLVADPGDNALTPAFWQSLLEIVERTKNARSHMGVTDVRRRSTCLSYSAGAVQYGLALVIPAAPELESLTYSAGAVNYGLALTVSD